VVDFVIVDGDVLVDSGSDINCIAPLDDDVVDFVIVDAGLDVINSTAPTFDVAAFDDNDDEEDFVFVPLDINSIAFDDDVDVVVDDDDAVFNAFDEAIVFSLKASLSLINSDATFDDDDDVFAGAGFVLIASFDVINSSAGFDAAAAADDDDDDDDDD